MGPPLKDFGQNTDLPVPKAQRLKGKSAPIGQEGPSVEDGSPLELCFRGRLSKRAGGSHA